MKKKNKDEIKLSRNIKITLKKCLNIDKLKYKTDFEEKEISVLQLIKDAMESSCMACNKSSQMWRDYYFEVRFEAETEFKNLPKEYIKEITDKKIESVKNKIKKKDKSKLENEKYMNNVIKNTIADAQLGILKDIEKRIIKERAARDGKGYGNIIQFYTKAIMKDYNTANVGQLDQSLVQANWSRDREDILAYKTIAPQYKRNTPFYIYNKNYILRRTDSGFEVDISILSKDGYSKYGLKNGTRFTFQVDKLGGSEKAILDRIINNEYNQGSAYLHLTDKNKLEMGISFSQDKPKEEISLLDKNRILGIDLGITNVATMSVYDSTKEEYDYVSYRYNVLKGRELIAFRQKLHNMGMSQKDIELEIQKYNDKLYQKQIRKFKLGCISGAELFKMRNTTERRRRDMSIASKTAGKGRCGHGYKTKMNAVNKIRNKISNFADTYNHKISKYIVEFAIKNNCGVIQMEDLSGATANTHNKMLKDWSYYDLQQKIEYKAKEQGIEVKKVNPKYTSKRCNKCGCIHEDNRNCKDNQAKFECQVCGHTENADINASKNIAIPNIDKIIKETEIIKTEKTS